MTKVAAMRGKLAVVAAAASALLSLLAAPRGALGERLEVRLGLLAPDLGLCTDGTTSCRAAELELPPLAPTDADDCCYTEAATCPQPVPSSDIVPRIDEYGNAVEHSGVVCPAKGDALDDEINELLSLTGRRADDGECTKLADLVGSGLINPSFTLDDRSSAPPTFTSVGNRILNEPCAESPFEDNECPRKTYRKCCANKRAINLSNRLGLLATELNLPYDGGVGRDQGSFGGDFSEQPPAIVIPGCRADPAFGIWKERCGGGGGFGGGGGGGGGGSGGGGGAPQFARHGPRTLPVAAGSPTCGTRRFDPNVQPPAGVYIEEPFSPSVPAEFPWSCLVLKGDNTFVATCVIIPNNLDNDVSHGTEYVMTVAHRLRAIGELDEVKVRIGEWDARSYDPTTEVHGPHRDYTVVAISENPGFDIRRLANNDLSNNIALLKLDKTIDLAERPDINAVCLPTCPDMFDYQFANGTGTRCWVQGWGKVDQDGNMRSIPNKVDIPLYKDRDVCECQLNKFIRGNFKLHDSELCAGGECGKDACVGDGGAPLVCRTRDDRWFVVGLVSWGPRIGCGRSNVPGVYTKVDFFRDWMRQVFARA